MSVMLLWIAGVIVLAVVWWWFRRPAPRATSAELAQLRAAVAPLPSATAARPAAVKAPSAPVIQPAHPVPPELASFPWKSESDLDAARREHLLAAVRGIPRPPRSMQRLLSPDFLASATSADLSELVMGEPLIAGKVLSTVNGPFYALHKPVTSIGQAVTFLGINSVRSICLQYMLAEAFKPKLAEAQKAFDRIWRASALASELAVRLGKALNLPDQSTLSTQVVLGFVGQLATASLLPPEGLAPWLQRDRLARARIEQDLLGLSASEVGSLLMKSWELPPALVSDVADSGRLLVTPADQIDPARLPRLALAYLCTRLGERLAFGQLDSLESYVPAADASVDMHHLRNGLTHPALARLDGALQANELQTALRQMMGQTGA